ncbi:O-linked N-acetylglucosamine transferase, SPINDLY family protein [Roseimaritima ulvae]|nr:hypothetical protein [Roseimaritima ulvae]
MGKRFWGQRIYMILLQHLPASGGTLISRCLASMQSVCLLSEIHPRGVAHFNPLRQAATWHGLIAEADVAELAADDIQAFGEVIAGLARRAADRGQRLVVRDWAHRDWLGRPFVATPPMRSAWDAILSAAGPQRFAAPTVPRWVTVRNPLDQFIHSKRMDALRDSWDDAWMWRGLRSFAEAVQSLPRFRYEDFLAAPAATLAAMCELADLPYDDDWQHRWRDYHNITGPPAGRQATVIRPVPREPMLPDQWDSLRDNEDLLATLDLLGYTVPEPLCRHPRAEATDVSGATGSSGATEDSGATSGKDWDQQVVHWRRAHAHRPDDVAAALRLADALRWTGQVHDAAEVLLDLARGEPPLTEDAQLQLLPLLCDVLQQSERKFEAIEFRRWLAALAPQHCDNLFQLSVLLAGLGEVDESLEYCRRLLQLDHRHRGAAANFLLYINYSDKYTSAEIANQHFRLGMRFSDRPQPLPPRSRRSGEKLRIGYLASDFYTHPVGKIMLPILQAHDRQRFHVAVYHDGRQSDAITRATLATVDQFTSFHGCSDESVFQRLRDDGLDVLIDLGGYTGGGNRLHVLARRVAPVQVSFLGYPNTSAVPAIDYHLTDRFADPPGLTEHLYGEQLVWLEHAILAWRPYGCAAKITVESRGGPLLGLFNNVAKISPSALAAYAAILRRVPDARLILKYGDRYGVRSLRDRYRREFAAQGVLPHRLEFRTEAEPLEQHLRTMMSVDLALDAFPYQGTMTSLECLAVGTPIVSCCGDYYAHRATSAMMMRMGLHELVAEDAEEYVEIAVQLLEDLEWLRQLRAGVRERFYHSPLTDPVGLTRELEAKLTGWVATPGAVIESP